MDAQIAWSICDRCVDLDCLYYSIGNLGIISDAQRFSCLHCTLIFFVFGHVFLAGWSTRNIGRQLQNSVSTKEKYQACMLKSDRRGSTVAWIPRLPGPHALGPTSTLHTVCIEQRIW